MGHRAISVIESVCHESASLASIGSAIDIRIVTLCIVLIQRGFNCCFVSKLWAVLIVSCKNVADSALLLSLYFKTGKGLKS